MSAGLFAGLPSTGAHHGAFRRRAMAGTTSVIGLTYLLFTIAGDLQNTLHENNIMVDSARAPCSMAHGAFSGLWQNDRNSKLAVSQSAVSTVVAP